MNRTASIRIKGIDIRELKENLPFISLLVLSVISILLGALSVNFCGYDNFTSKVFSGYLSARSDGEFIVKLFSVALDTFKYPVLSFIFASSVVGIALSPLALIYLSFCYGAISATLYADYGITGIVFNLFVLMLPSIIFILSFIVSTKDCVGFSLKIARICSRDKRPVNLYNDFKLLCLRHLFLIIPLVISVFLDVLLFEVFKKFLNT